MSFIEMAGSSLLLTLVSPQDDIIDDVESFVAAAEILKERGAYKIYVMATHGILSAEAPRLIEESSIDEVGLLLTGLEFAVLSSGNGDVAPPMLLDGPLKSCPWCLALCWARCIGRS